MKFQEQIAKTVFCRVEATKQFLKKPLDFAILRSHRPLCI
jgi:hypothetical protein